MDRQMTEDDDFSVPDIPLRAQDWKTKDRLPTFKELRRMQDEVNRRQTTAWVRALMAASKSMGHASQSGAIDRAQLYKLARRNGIAVSSTGNGIKVRRYEESSSWAEHLKRLSTLTPEQRADYDLLRKRANYTAKEAWAAVTKTKDAD